MKRIYFLVLGVIFVIGCATTSGLQKTSVPSAKIEKVEFNPDKSGDYYAYVTVRNISGNDKAFYIIMKAEEQPSQLTASGPSGEAKPIRAGATYTFQLNTLLKKEPKNVSIEITDKLPR